MTIELAKLNELAHEIHAANVKAGWWTDIKTGESTLPTRNRAELMMLVVSEVSEADHGLLNGLQDDKLPHLPMFDVELADTAIRLFDTLGAEAALHGGDPVTPEALDLFDEAFDDLRDYYAHGPKQEMAIINKVSAAMEHLRKGRTAFYRGELSQALVMCFVVAKVHNIDLFSVIEEKRSFNANRADHKIENRLKDDGKKF